VISARSIIPHIVEHKCQELGLRNMLPDVQKYVLLDTCSITTRFLYFNLNRCTAFLMKFRIMYKKKSQCKTQNVESNDTNTQKSLCMYVSNVM